VVPGIPIPVTAYGKAATPHKVTPALLLSTANLMSALVVALWLHGALYSSTGPTEQKAVNLATNPHVAVTKGRNTRDDGLDVMVEGEGAAGDRPADPRTARGWLADQVE
jgi:hypothetical protein